MTGTSIERLRVTYLELCAAPAPPPERGGDGERVGLEAMTREAYLALYRCVGEPLRWDTRLKLPRAELEELLGGARLRIYVLRASSGDALGFCEFDRRAFPDIELTHFGLKPDAQGRRLGLWLLSTALGREWECGASRIWLHTDTWDHPGAIPTYERAGFRVFKVRCELPDAL